MRVWARGICSISARNGVWSDICSPSCGGSRLQLFESVLLEPQCLGVLTDGAPLGLIESRRIDCRDSTPEALSGGVAGAGTRVVPTPAPPTYTSFYGTRLLNPREIRDSDAARFAHAATEKRGAANRTHRNMLVFLAADSDRLAEVDAAVRGYLGWKNVSERAHELGLTLQQIQQANERKERSSTTVDDRILGAYHWILAPEWPQSAQSFTLTATKAEGAAASLAERVSKRMITDSTLNTERAASLIRLDIANHLSTLWDERGHISVEELWGYYTDYPYMPRLRDRDVLDAGIQGFSQGHMYWQQESFAVADGVDDTGRYLGLVLPTDDRPITVRNTTLLVRPDVAEQQRAQETPPETAPADSTPDSEHTAAGKDLSLCRCDRSARRRGALRLWKAERFHHTAQFERWQPDRDPCSCHVLSTRTTADLQPGRHRLGSRPNQSLNRRFW